MATSDFAAHYRAHGYAVIPALLGAADIAELVAEAATLSRTEQPGGCILALHFPHKMSTRFRAAMRHPALLAPLAALIGPDVKAMQSMLFIKPPGKPGQAWHQDEHFLPTRDRSLCGVWLALDDAAVENGCLWAHPGSHVPGILYRTAPHHDARFDASEEAQDIPFAREGGTALELTAGDALFFDGYLLHRSLPNTSVSASRRSLVIHYMSARSLLPWNHDGHSPTDDFRDIELIAGTDPYAWKGRHDILRPFVRAEVNR